MEAVKQLKELMDLDDHVSPHLDETSVVAVCTNPLLPQVFRAVCQAKGTGIVFSRLGKDGPKGNKIQYIEMLDMEYITADLFLTQTYYGIILRCVPHKCPDKYEYTIHL